VLLEPGDALPVVLQVVQLTTLPETTEEDEEVEVVEDHTEAQETMIAATIATTIAMSAPMIIDKTPVVQDKTVPLLPLFLLPQQLRQSPPLKKKMAGALFKSPTRTSVVATKLLEAHHRQKESVD